MTTTGSFSIRLQGTLATVWSARAGLSTASRARKEENRLLRGGFFAARP